MNTELFKKIHDVIKVDPDKKLNMSSWEAQWPGCGTTRCLAGWAIYLTTGQPLFDRVSGDASQATEDLSRELGFPRVSIPLLADDLLGMNEEGEALFYVDEETALEFVKLAAEGKVEEALNHLHNS